MSVSKSTKYSLIKDKYEKSLSLLKKFGYQHSLKNASDKSELEVFSFGQGEPILLLPPGGMTVTVWLKQIQKWSSDYRLIVIHPPAHGLSKSNSTLSFKLIAEWTLEALNLVEDKPVHLIGASFGGIVAQHLAALEPNKLKSLVLANTLCSNSWSVSDFQEEGVVDFLSGIVEREFENLKNANTELDYKSDSHLLRVSSNVDIFRIFKYMRLLFNASTLSFVDSIKTPALALCGGLDPVIDKKETRLLSSKIQGCAFHEIKGAGHFCFATHSEEFNDKTMEFIQNF